jgi:hypothetical protein
MEIEAFPQVKLRKTDRPRRKRDPCRIGRSDGQCFIDTSVCGLLAAVDALRVHPLQEAADLLYRAYPTASAAELRAQTKQRLAYTSRLLSRRLTLTQHRELFIAVGWLALLLGCVHYDLGEREQAEAPRQAAYQAGLQAGHGEIIAWSYEMAAWFALTEGRYCDVVAYAQAGQQHAGLTNAMIQLVLQQARGQARLGSATATTCMQASTAAPGSWSSCPGPSTRRTTSCSTTPSGSSTPPPAHPARR